MNVALNPAAKPRGGGHAAVLCGQEGVPAHRGPRRRLRPVQDGGQHGGVHSVLLRSEGTGWRKGMTHPSTSGLEKKDGEEELLAKKSKELFI